MRQFQMNFTVLSDFGDTITSSRQVSLENLTGSNLAKVRAAVLEKLKEENPGFKISSEPIITFIFELDPE